MASVEVPATVQAFARAAGAGGWLTGLPELVGRLERDWGLTVGHAYDDATGRSSRRPRWPTAPRPCSSC